jgi:hypothetical protein
LIEFELTPEEMEKLRGNPEGNFAWNRGSHLRDEEVVAMIDEMCRD